MNESAVAESLAPDHGVTELLVAWSGGDQDALTALIPIIYGELRRIAQRHMRRESPERNTLETTALVHEAYLRLMNQKEMNWRNRAHFFAASSQSMRHILIDMARSRQTGRRGSGAYKVSLEDAFVFSPERASELVALDEALSALEKLDERKSRIIELRFFGGLSIEETAAVLDVSPETVWREWKRAKAWLYCQLSPSGGSRQTSTTRD